MTTSYEISFKTTYKDTDFTRQYTISDVESVSAATEIVRTKINNINESLASGTAQALSNLFVADDYDSSEGIGNLIKIIEPVIKVTTITPIEKTSTRNIEEDIENGDIDNSRLDDESRR